MCHAAAWHLVKFRGWRKELFPLVCATSAVWGRAAQWDFWLCYSSKRLFKLGSCIRADTTSCQCHPFVMQPIPRCSCRRISWQTNPEKSLGMAEALTGVLAKCVSGTNLGSAAGTRWGNENGNTNPGIMGCVESKLKLSVMTLQE